MKTNLAFAPTTAEPVQKLALTRAETARALSLSPATVDRLVKRGQLRPSRATRRPLFAVSDLESFLHQTS